MKTRKLRDLEVSAIGMGCMGFTHAYGEGPSESEGIRLVHKAFELGCNFFDTAEMYSYICLPILFWLKLLKSMIKPSGKLR